MICDFCMTDYEADKIDKRAKSYTCSRCVQLLLSASQEKLAKAHKLAIKHNKHTQVRAIESFLEEGTDEYRNEHRRNDIIKRNNRERTIRNVRTNIRTAIKTKIR